MPEQLFSSPGTPNPAFFPLSNPTVDLFDKTARQLAKELNLTGKNTNKPTQIRKFYDELLMWRERAGDPDSFARHLPFIKMLNAKVAYAKGRKLVDENFEAWFNCCLDQIKSGNEDGLNTFRNFCTHFEAFLGFYKAERPND